MMAIDRSVGRMIAGRRYLMGIHRERGSFGMGI